MDLITNKTSEVRKLLKEFPKIEDGYDVLCKIGEGSFSKVYKATKKFPPGDPQLYALKCIISSSEPKRIAAELKYMIKLGGKKNIMGLSNCEIINGNVIMVMPYFQHNSFLDYVEQLNFQEIRDYMFNLFIALEYLSENGIIHRDVKPSNFLYNRVTEKYSLVDFGLAQCVQNSKLSSTTNSKTMRSLKVPKMKESNTSSVSQVEINQSCKRNLEKDLNVAESTIPELLPKKLCLDEDETTTTTNNSNDIKALQPLGTSNRINVTVLPPGSDAIKKPAIVLHRKVLFKENNKANDMPKTLCSIKESVIGPPESSSFINISRPISPSAEPMRISCNISAPGTSRSSIISKSSQSCQCFGKKTVCSICLSKPQEYAPRAGTPGFRPPEVLIKYPNQTTAVDMWAAGVIFISLISRRYPFFTNSEDMIALAEIICILGINKVKKAALRLGKVITIQTEYPAKDLHMLCQGLRDNLETTNCKKETIPSSAINLLYHLLEPDPANRITASEALKHPFITQKYMKTKASKKS